MTDAGSEPAPDFDAVLSVVMLFRFFKSLIKTDLNEKKKKKHLKMLLG